MVKLPWRSDDGPSVDDAVDEDADWSSVDEPDDEAAVVSCEFQDGVLRVYDDRVAIDRTGASSFEDKTIPVEEILDVAYAGRLVIGYLQIEQIRVPPDSASRFSTPVDENTLHFGRGKRDCARRARDAILERLAE